MRPLNSSGGGKEEEEQEQETDRKKIKWREQLDGTPTQ